MTSSLHHLPGCSQCTKVQSLPNQAATTRNTRSGAPEADLYSSHRRYPQRESPVMDPSKAQRQKTKASKKGLFLDYITNSFFYENYSDSKSTTCDHSDSLTECLRSVNSISSDRSKGSSTQTLLNSDSSNEILPRKASAISCHRLVSDFPVKECPSITLERYQYAGTFTLDDIDAIDTVKVLAARYGRISHMGILDRSYSFFINKARTAALSYKVQNKVAVVEGDPLCEPDYIPTLLAEFRTYRKKCHLDIAFMGASGTFADYAKERGWINIQFGQERVLNPMTNEVLLERSGKRIIVQCRQLLDQSKGGISLGIYTPADAEDLCLQQELSAVYDTWRQERNKSSSIQAFITVYDPFSLRDLMTYIYTRGPDGVANGFAALRKIGANQGYHLDPCVAAPGSPRGVSDLLVLAAMAILNRSGVSYLSFGYEPLDALEEITGMPYPLERVTRRLYNHTFQRLPIGGKKAYHNKFKPDHNQGSSLHVIFPSAIPTPRQIIAIAHMTNVSIRRLIFTDERAPVGNPEAKENQRMRSKEVSSDKEKNFQAYTAKSTLWSSTFRSTAGR